MILVLGCSGQVARELASLGAEQSVTCLGRNGLDLGVPGKVATEIHRSRPRFVINAAAYTAVDKAEAEQTQAWRLNVEAPGEAARACAEAGIPFVHISTDYVFAGDKKGPYGEYDPLGPTGAYGRSKAAGEGAVAASGSSHAIVRTAWVYSPYGTNFVKTILRLAETRDEISVVADQHGNPTHAADLASACLVIGERLAAGDHDCDGVLHYAGRGDAVWADVASEVLNASAALGGPKAEVRRITTEEYPTPARRPTNSLLSTKRAEALGLALFDWKPRVHACVAEVLRTLSLD